MQSKRRRLADSEDQQTAYADLKCVDYQLLQQKVDQLCMRSVNQEESIARLQHDVEVHVQRVAMVVDRDTSITKQVADLVQSVEELARGVSEHESCLAKLKSSGLSPGAEAMLVLQHLFVQVPNVMFRFVFPESYAARRAYAYSDIRFKISGLPTESQRAERESRLQLILSHTGWSEALAKKTRRFLQCYQFERRSQSSSSRAAAALTSPGSLSQYIALVDSMQWLHKPDVPIFYQVADAWTKLHQLCHQHNLQTLL